MTDFWVLDGHTPVPATVEEWGAFFESPRRFLWETRMVDGVRIVTVFLGHDPHYILGERGEPPLLFGTIIFGGPLNHQESLYATWDEAEAGHEAAVSRVKEAAADG